jgi:hypothetical protein
MIGDWLGIFAGVICTKQTSLYSQTAFQPFTPPWRLRRSQAPAVPHRSRLVPLPRFPINHINIHARSAARHFTSPPSVSNLSSRICHRTSAVSIPHEHPGRLIQLPPLNRPTLDPGRLQFAALNVPAPTLERSCSHTFQVRRSVYHNTKHVLAFTATHKITLDKSF